MMFWCKFVRSPSGGCSTFVHQAYVQALVLSVCLLLSVVHGAPVQHDENPGLQPQHAGNPTQGQPVEEKEKQADLKAGSQSFSEQGLMANRPKRSTFFMESTLLFDDGGKQESHSARKSGFMADKGKQQGRSVKKSDFIEDEGKKEVKDTFSESSLKASSTGTVEGFPPLFPDEESEKLFLKRWPNTRLWLKYARESRHFLQTYLDSENFLEAFLNASLITQKDIDDINRQPDTASRRRAFHSFWLSRQVSPKTLKDFPDYFIPFTKVLDGIEMYHLFKMCRPGLFPEVSWKHHREEDVMSLQIPPLTSFVGSCRLQAMNNVLSHKTHFIQNMEATPELENFFSKVTARFDNDVDKRNRKLFMQKRKGTRARPRWADELTRGYWLHCLDYASEEKKFEFLTMMKEKQPAVLSENPLSDLMSTVESIHHSETCEEEKLVDYVLSYFPNGTKNTTEEEKVVVTFSNQVSSDDGTFLSTMYIDRVTMKLGLKEEGEKPLPEVLEYSTASDMLTLGSNLPMLLTGEWLVEVSSPTISFTDRAVGLPGLYENFEAGKIDYRNDLDEEETAKSLAMKEAVKEWQTTFIKGRQDGVAEFSMVFDLTSDRIQREEIEMTFPKGKGDSAEITVVIKNRLGEKLTTTFRIEKIQNQSPDRFGAFNIEVLSKTQT